MNHRITLGAPLCALAIAFGFAVPFEKLHAQGATGFGGAQSLTTMSENDFRIWLRGTGWTLFTPSGEVTLRFVSPETVLLSKKSGADWLPAQTLSLVVEAPGTLKLDWSVADPEGSSTVTVRADLKEISLVSSDNVASKAPLLNRVEIGLGATDFEARFTEWLLGKEFGKGGEEPALQFKAPTRGIIASTADGKEVPARVIAPFTVEFGEPGAMSLLVVSPELSGFQIFTRQGAEQGLVALKQERKKVEAAPQTEMNASVNALGLRPAVDAASVGSVVPTGTDPTGKTVRFSLKAVAVKEGPDRGKALVAGAHGAAFQSAVDQAMAAVRTRHNGWFDEYTIEITPDPDLEVSDAGAAGAALTLAMESLLGGSALDSGFSVLGAVNADGTLVALSPEEARLLFADLSGISLLAIPKANENLVIDRVILSGPKALALTQFYTVKTLDDALAIGRGDRGKELAEAVAIWEELRPAFVSGDLAELIKHPKAVERLQRIHELAPDNLSASLLLAASEGKFPKSISPAGTLAALDTGIGAVSAQLSADGPVNVAVFQHAKAQLSRLRAVSDPSLNPLLDAWSQWANVADTLAQQNQSAGARAQLETLMKNVREAEAKVRESLKSGE